MGFIGDVGLVLPIRRWRQELVCNVVFAWLRLGGGVAGGLLRPWPPTDP
ncbi:MAG: hypothetical protein Q4G14_07430 [Paracoccus sp. (in: a-proteobacteria)]|nr:hypothetical protein [Paracoccus sp. (in: a-proteobacteria)]MDO5613060.1 hypothetical protein [Paracoccus sp. (in: a-proteobacteria)]